MRRFLGRGQSSSWTTLTSARWPGKAMKLPCWIPNWYQTQISMAPLLDVGEARAGLGFEPRVFFQE